MNFKPAVWRPIAFVLSAVNLAAVAFATPAWHATAHAALALAFGVWATRLSQSPAAAGDVAHMQDLLDEQTDALEDARHALSGQSAQLAELQERVDFAERMLGQSRERVLRKPEEHA